jgi:nucleotidyltransferase substrate binding protein (TIGR01987 family)
MSDELIYSFEKFLKALKKLDEGIKKAKDQLDNDGVIQRFEFTFELTWKTLRLYLLAEGINTNSPKEALKAAYRLGLLDDEDIFLDMLTDRNQAAHIYSEDFSKKTISRIKKNYLNAFQKLSKELKKRLTR